MKKNLINIEHTGRIIHLWYVDENGKLLYEIDRNFRPYFYRLAKFGSNYKTIDGYNVEKVYVENPYEIREEKSKYGKTWESDIDYITKYLIDTNVYEWNRQSGLLPVRTWFIDIENFIGDRFPNPRVASNQIIMISFYDNLLDKIITVAYHPEEYKNKAKWSEENVIVCETEKEMLEVFVQLIIKLRPQILSGWNSEDYDFPYILNRILKVCGGEVLKRLSPISKVDINNQMGRYKVYGLIELDYLKLYRKFSINLRESYSLEYISRYEIKEGKNKLVEKLDDIWRNNFSKCVEYNRNDVLLVKKLDDKLKYIDLARELVSTCNVELRNVYFNSTLNEALILSKLKKKNMVCFNRPDYGEKFDPYEGAFVVDPTPGFHEWLFSLDLTSLYPSIIRSCNMDFTTIVESAENKETCFRTSNNQYFKRTPRGIIPEILDELFDRRVNYKNLLKKAIQEGNDWEKYHYDLKQYTIKILLNSMYGYLGMPSGRFFNKRIAEGVTLTGKSILKSTIEYINEKYSNILEVIAGDTDSVYVKVLDKKIKPDKDRVLKIANIVLKDINENLLNRFASEECNIKNSNHYFTYKFEKIIRSALFVAKKRYALKVIWEEGFDVDNELKITGIEIVRSDTPQSCKNFIMELLEMILDKKSRDEIDKYIVSFQNKIKSIPIVDVGFPVGVKGIKKYRNPNPTSMHESMLSIKGTPAHVKAAINYNTYFSRWGNSNEYPLIKEGEKIKWIYVKPTIKYPFSTIAFTDDNYSHVDEFIIDWDKVIHRLITQKVENIFKPMGWNMPVDKSQMISEELFV